ncbi:hypothetical protein Ciccas_004412 [Cichlidogyrus casuarinus]|uniref:Uncharacterized protein n=1 Tax=Cichlidogyrus casuarinus TaxID=1844966 RepID=A0ABD2QBN2_9PLAT
MHFSNDHRLRTEEFLKLGNAIFRHPSPIVTTVSLRAVRVLMNRIGESSKTLEMVERNRPNLWLMVYLLLLSKTPFALGKSSERLSLTAFDAWKSIFSKHLFNIPLWNSETTANDFSVSAFFDQTSLLLQQAMAEEKGSLQKSLISEVFDPFLAFICDRLGQVFRSEEETEIQLLYEVGLDYLKRLSKVVLPNMQRLDNLVCSFILVRPTSGKDKPYYATNLFKRQCRSYAVPWLRASLELDYHYNAHNLRVIREIIAYTCTLSDFQVSKSLIESLIADREFDEHKAKIKAVLKLTAHWLWMQMCERTDFDFALLKKQQLFCGYQFSRAYFLFYSLCPLAAVPLLALDKARLLSHPTATELREHIKSRLAHISASPETLQKYCTEISTLIRRPLSFDTLSKIL